MALSKIIPESINLASDFAGMGFGGTGAANQLDDYEEGTWTPAIGNTSGSAISTSDSCRYVKIGNFVYLQFDITNDTGATGNQVFGLPFAVGRNAGATIGWQNTSTDLSMYIDGGNNSLYFVPLAGSGSATINTSGRVIGSGMYEITD